MVITENIKLPEYSELDVEELNVTFPILRAAAFFVGKQCEQQTYEYMLCKNEEHDPRVCLNEGKAVTACAVAFFKKLKKHCKEDLARYARCIESSSKTFDYGPCRKTQKAFDECVLENLNLERPPFGYFCETKIHDTSRPRPEKGPLIFPNPLPPLPEDKPEHPSRFSSRMPWAF